MIKTLTIVTIFVSILLEVNASEWIKRADFPNVGRHRGTALSIGNKGYMGLGHFNGAGPNIILNDWWEYDPATNAWTQKANYVGNSGIGSYGVLTFSMEQFGYVGGGQVGLSGEFYRFDPTTNTWTPAANTPTYAGNISGFVIGTKGYYMTGNSVYEYDSVTDVWTTKNPAPFSNGIWNSSFTIDGKGYMKSGNSLWEYKPSIDQWSPRASLPPTAIATAGSVGLTQYGKGYIITGYGGGLSNVTKQVWAYEPGTNTWDSLPDFTGSARRFSSGFSIGNRCYIGTGTNGTNFADFWEFDAYAGLKEMFDANQFTCYPNPATAFVNFQSENLNEFEIVIYDQLGKLIEKKSTKDSRVKINRENKISGIYFYQVISSESVVHSGKFIFK